MKETSCQLTGDIEGVRLLLQAGADPNRLPPPELYGAQYADDPPWPAAYAAIRSGCSVELIYLLLEHGADPNAPGPDGRSPHQLALRQGAVEVAPRSRLSSRKTSPSTRTVSESLLFLRSRRNCGCRNAELRASD